MRYLFPLSPYNQQRQFQKPAWVYPAHLAMYATYLRDHGHEVIWDSTQEDLHGPELTTVIKNDFQIDVPFDQLPFPDRTFTDAKHPRWQSYGNYKLKPATHMMASNLCWWGRCTFCVDTLKLQKGEKRGLRSVDHVLEEVDDLIRLGFREVFDDSGTFPIGDWLKEFCEKMIESGRNKKIVLGCNMKPIAEKVVPFKLMKKAGFRFILVGVESSNQRTIDIIQKGQESHKVIENMKAMNDAGLEVHLTSMFGYPWETHDDAMRTVREIHHLLLKGYVKTAQASVYMPPRTAPEPSSPAQKYIQKVYDIYKDPRYWLRKIIDIKRPEDITYLLSRLNHVKHAE
jgi:radical SAM superfamily enzyme YgiQ (UPF0313 family)